MHNGEYVSPSSSVLFAAVPAVYSEAVFSQLLNSRLVFAATFMRLGCLVLSAPHRMKLV